MRAIVMAFAVASLFAACTPYTYASTGRTLAQGATQKSMMMSMVPGGMRSDSSDASAALPNFDMEWRHGLDDRSDVGVRINALSGAIVTYKRRLDDPRNSTGIATAISGGAGFVNGGQHAHVEATLVASGREDGTATGYGGLRVIQVKALSDAFPEDTPTAGVFGGVRLGSPAFGILLELGAFYDKSALKLRPGNFVVVPSISVSSVRLGRRNRR